MIKCSCIFDLRNSASWHIKPSDRQHCGAQKHTNGRWSFKASFWAIAVLTVYTQATLWNSTPCHRAYVQPYLLFITRNNNCVFWEFYFLFLLSFASFLSFVWWSLLTSTALTYCILFLWCTFLYCFMFNSVSSFGQINGLLLFFNTGK